MAIHACEGLGFSIDVTNLRVIHSNSVYFFTHTGVDERGQKISQSKHVVLPSNMISSSLLYISFVSNSIISFHYVFFHLEADPGSILNALDVF